MPDTSTYHLQIRLAEDAEGRMPYGDVDPVARFRPAGDALEVTAESIEDAMEIAYTLANVGPVVSAADEAEAQHFFEWVRTYRERDRSRSLSVGDVIVVNGEAGYAVDHVGYRPVNDHERDVLARSAAYTT